MRAYSVPSKTATWLDAGSAREGVAAAHTDKTLRSGSLRRKLWELPDGYHCSVIGTCLSLAENEKAARKAGIIPRNDSIGDSLHRLVVGRSTTRNDLSRILHKTLDRKFAAEIHRFAKLTTEEELLRAWEEARDGGNIAGAYWALMTHPARTDAAALRMFSEVHMMSHLLGGETRESVRRVARLGRENDRLKEDLVKARAKARETAATQERKIRDLDTELSSLKGRLARLPSSGPSGRSAAAARRRTAAREVMERRLRAERARARRAEAALPVLEDRIRSLEARLRAIDRSALAAEIGPTHRDTLTPCALDGRIILYVGGRTSQAPRLRVRVERRAGVFVYHDGGLEDGSQKLSALISRADAVFCPVDCVSHGACQQVKRLCRRWAKEFIPLRSAGTSSFERAIQAYATADADCARS